MNLLPVSSPCGGTAINMTVPRGETVALTGMISMNLTGYTAKMQVGFPSPLLLTSANGGITFPTGGSFQINIPDTTTETLPVGPYPYDCWIISPSGQAIRILFGEFTVKASTTPIP